MFNKNQLLEATKRLAKGLISKQSKFVLVKKNNNPQIPARQQLINYVHRKFVIPKFTTRQKFLFASLSVKIVMVPEIKAIRGKQFAG